MSQGSYFGPSGDVWEPFALRYMNIGSASYAQCVRAVGPKQNSARQVSWRQEKCMRKTQGPTIHIATGGFAHFLGLLEGTFFKAAKTHTPLFVETRHHKPLAWQPLENLLDLGPLSGLLVDYSDWLNSPDALGIEHLPGRRRKYEVRVGDWTSIIAEGREPTLQGGAQSYRLTVGSMRPRYKRFNFLVENIRLQRDAMERLEKLVPNDFREINYLGVHLRGSDRRTNLRASFDEVDKLVRRDRFDRVYVSTDDYALVEGFRDKFPGLNIVGNPMVRRLKFEGNLHYGVHDQDAKLQLLALLTDLYALSNAREFIPAIGSRTAWTELVKALRTSKNLFF